MAYNSFKPGKPWLDTSGKPIQAHGFSVFYNPDEKLWYWYGENKEKTVGGKSNTVWHWGVRLYTSPDLYNWTDKGLIIPPTPEDLSSPIHPTYCMDRPHILYCKKTKKYVVWLKIMAGEVSQFMSVMQADKLEGPYEFANKIYKPYAIFEEGEWADRDKLEPKHFKKWVDFCKARGLGADFNPTFFSHPKCDPLTLSSPNEETRRFWINHGKACIRISQYLAQELGQPCVMNIWTGDGFKDIPGDRLGPRVRYRESIDEILTEPYDFKLVKDIITITFKGGFEVRKEIDSGN